ncbi:CDP-diacylglycerol---serine O-phosphatidyltransferase [Desulfonauticus submarinus]|uniref:CDP-diacylglycerol--serine O-phosphatidyltransferase n=1 Tax=Desulfonauticus submarinus TaxID=206665 RepID=A0A1H0B3R3_9BACT|nr:CDP-diacylglycerol--serine O-phosphatidyltransferase [Desulfonauticus submarinus]SDN40311.1 CDP-diacylglycerol---serine O-phosphatidyltransferase [Desulfonauticus submarinus]
MNSNLGPKHKSLYVLPNLLTTASLFAGFWGMLLAINGAFEQAALAILISCFFDGIDGKVARLTRASSDFGIQYDSLADLVAFGVGPALLVYLWQTHVFGRIGIMVSFLFLACGALRLARFNLQAKVSSKKFFIGLPIPAAACTLATFILFHPYIGFIPSIWMARLTLGLTFLLALTMVSKIKYASFKDVEMARAHPFTSTVLVIFLFALIASEPKFLGFVFFILYVFSGYFYTLIFLPLRKSNLREFHKELS